MTDDDVADCLVIAAREKAATELSVIISMSREKKKSTAADDTCIYCIRSTILLSKDNLFVIFITKLKKWFKKADRVVRYTRAIHWQFWSPKNTGAHANKIRRTNGGFFQ